MNSKRRLPAEWEAQSFVQFTFPHPATDWAANYEAALACFVECIVAVSQFTKVLVVCEDPISTKAYLHQIPTTQLRLVSLPSNDTWARDHGGITIWEDGKAVVLDFQFNAWGLKFAADKDNRITRRLHKQQIFETATLRTLNFVLEGGSIESDGQGTLLTTSQCLLAPNRNPQFERADIEQYLTEIFGLKRILWLENGALAGDDTDAHIDTLARFCNPNTIAYVQCQDPKDTHYASLQKMEAELQAFHTTEGKPYQLFPLPFPDAIFDANGSRLPATYANFLITNGGVVVPTYGVPQDEIAIEVMQSIFPDRTVVGVNCHPLLVQGGSLHCVSMQYSTYAY